MGDHMTTSLKRSRSLLVTLALVAATNIAISRLAERTGVPIIPNSPRPKSNVEVAKENHGQRTGVPIIPNSPRPRTGVPIIPNSPRP